MLIDLHAHSNVSDGTQPPADVVRRAHANGVGVLALTDHDSIAGHAEAAAALPRGVTLIPGMELSCRLDGRSLHMLAYLFDPAAAQLAAECERIREDRIHGARAMVDRLTELGAPVTWEQVLRVANGAVVGRPHVARAMLDAGVVEDIEEAFSDRWLGEGGRAHVKRYALQPERAIELVRAAGGVTVLAHARVYRDTEAFSDQDIAGLADAGLGGIEVDHPGHEEADRAALRGLAADLGLFVTGASDDHGEPTGHRLGSETTSPESLEALLAMSNGRSRPSQGT